MAGENPFGDIFGNGFGPSEALRAFAKKEEKGQPWRAKVIEGEYYIPLSQVADLLRENDILPKVRAGIERRVKDGPPHSGRQTGKTAAAEDLGHKGV